MAPPFSTRTIEPMQTTETSGQPADATGPDRGEVRAAAAAAVAPDPLTADLLAKHSAGVKLTQPEYGKIGAFAAKVKTWFGPARKDGAPVGSPQPGPAPGHAPAVAALAPAQASDSGLAPVPIDAGLARRTTNALL